MFYIKLIFKKLFNIYQEGDLVEYSPTYMRINSREIYSQDYRFGILVGFETKIKGVFINNLYTETLAVILDQETSEYIRVNKKNIKHALY